MFLLAAPLVVLCLCVATLGGGTVFGWPWYYFTAQADPNVSELIVSVSQVAQDPSEMSTHSAVSNEAIDTGSSSSPLTSVPASPSSPVVAAKYPSSVSVRSPAADHAPSAPPAVLPDTPVHSPSSATPHSARDSFTPSPPAPVLNPLHAPPPPDGSNFPLFFSPSASPVSSSSHSDTATHPKYQEAPEEVSTDGNNYRFFGSGGGGSNTDPPGKKGGLVGWLRNAAGLNYQAPPPYAGWGYEIKRYAPGVLFALAMFGWYYWYPATPVAIFIFSKMPVFILNVASTPEALSFGMTLVSSGVVHYIAAYYNLPPVSEGLIDVGISFMKTNKSIPNPTPGRLVTQTYYNTDPDEHFSTCISALAIDIFYYKGPFVFYLCCICGMGLARAITYKQLGIKASRGDPLAVQLFTLLINFAVLGLPLVVAVIGYFSESALSTHVKMKNDSNVKIIVCGNPGRGKSSICNALVQQAETFVTGDSPTAVTKNLQTCVCSHVGRFKNCVVCDVPGLLEAGYQNETHNAEQLRLSVNVKPTRTVVLFVADASGRLDSSDVEAYEAICKDFLRVGDGSPNCVVLGNRAHRNESFRQEWKDLFLKTTNSRHVNFAFIPKVNDDSDMISVLREHVLSSLHGASPAILNPSKNNAMSRLTKATKAQAEWQRRAEEERLELERRLERERAENQARIEAQQRQDEWEREQERLRRQQEIKRMEREREEARREAEKLRRQREEEEEEQQQQAQLYLQQQHHQLAFVPGLGVVRIQQHPQVFFHPHAGFGFGGGGFEYW